MFKSLSFKVFFVIFLFFYFLFPKNCYAIYDPENKPNNKFGIHILFANEITGVSKLVNSGNGDWGYVTIPIQYSDRNLKKWQNFMDLAKTYHLIPIIRLATGEDPFNKGTWRKPDAYDLIDFANFLNSLTWPISNRYVVLFNEVNRSDEWGKDQPDPKSYAEVLSDAYEIFKERSSDFFLLSAGLDNAAPNASNSMNEFSFLKKMYFYDNNIFNKIDGFASHSYPNPGFISSPVTNKKMGISTYKFEEDYINLRAVKRKPVFITETGWDNEILGEDVVATFYKTSFQKIWQDDRNVIAVTPFLFNSQGGPFDKFSFLKNGEETKYFKEISNLPKIKGQPNLFEQNTGSIMEVLAEKISKTNDIEIKTFSDFHDKKITIKLNPLFKSYFKFILGI